MLKAYIDDSADAGRQSHLVVGGYVATEEKWAAFSEEWKQNLEYHGLEEFKCSMMPNGSKPEFTANFYRIIEKHLDLAVDCYINIADLKEVIDTLPTAMRELPIINKLRNPYYLATKWIMRGLYHNIENLEHQGTIDFIFDEQTGVDSSLVLGWDYFRSCLVNDKYVGAAPIFANSKVLMPLQAADLLVWHLRKAKESGKDYLCENIFAPWKCNKDIRRLAIFFEKENLKKELDWILCEDNEQQFLAHSN